jgi:RNAse (barnase) inhibitor barstar
MLKQQQEINNQLNSKAMIKNDIGINAGIIWQLLNEKGALPINAIETHTKFSNEYVLYALGWLARENNIVFFEKDDVMQVKLTNNFSEMYF